MDKRTEERQMTHLDAIEKDVVIETFRSRGPGGQRRNKVETAVRIRHLPTGIVVLAREHRSQAMNKALAFERLRERLIAMNRRKRPRRLTKVPLRAKVARRQEKLHRSRIKRFRQKVDEGQFF